MKAESASNKEVGWVSSKFNAPNRTRTPGPYGRPYGHPYGRPYGRSHESSYMDIRMDIRMDVRGTFIKLVSSHFILHAPQHAQGLYLKHNKPPFTGFGGALSHLPLGLVLACLGPFYFPPSYSAKRSYATYITQEVRGSPETSSGVNCK